MVYRGTMLHIPVSTDVFLKLALHDSSVSASPKKTITIFKALHSEWITIQLWAAAEKFHSTAPACNTVSCIKHVGWVSATLRLLHRARE